MINFKLLITYKSKGIKAFELADKAGIENTRFCRIVNGRLKPTKEEMKIISKILGVAQKNLF